MTSGPTPEASGLDWAALIEAAPSDAIPVLRAQVFLHAWPSASKPVAVKCDDGHEYVIKGSQAAGRMIVNEHVVGRLGMYLHAPVGQVVYVDISDLAAVEPRLNLYVSTVVHGTRLIPGCGDRATLEHVHVHENRSRFGALSVLYSWAGAGDHQLIYENQPPHLVHSVDHGHFFAGGPKWTTATLKQGGTATKDEFFDACALTELETASAAARLAAITPEYVAEVVKGPRADWQLALEERVELAEYLFRRKSQLAGVF